MTSTPSDGVGTRRLDVRETDGAPFAEVSSTLDALDERGFVHETTRTDDAYHVEIRHEQGSVNVGEVSMISIRTASRRSRTARKPPGAGLPGLAVALLSLLS